MLFRSLPNAPRVRMWLIDSGFRPGKRFTLPLNRVYEFCRKFPQLVKPTKGSSGKPARPISKRKQRELADHYIKALNIATPDAEKPISQLSGGNQQKAILGRWLALEPRLLLLDEPTRGIDVGAKAEIEALIGRLRKGGMAILFISSELEEVVQVSHRVAVLRDHAKIGELTGEQIDLPNIIRAIAAPAGDGHAA